MQTTTTPAPEPVAVKSSVIIRLVSKNYKRLKAVEVVPNHPVITLKGENEQGKSSVLQSILAVLSGKLCPRPIRDGESKSEIELEFGDFTAKLTITQTGGAKLTIRSKSGMPISSPRTFLEQHSNPILLDILGFIRQAETAEGRRKQAETLRKLVNLDFSALDREAFEKYTERTGVNRDLETAKGRLSNYPHDPSVPDEEVSIRQLSVDLERVQADGDKALAEAQEHNKQNQRVKQAWEELTLRITQRIENLANAASEITRLEEALALKKNLYSQEKLAIEELDDKRAQQQPIVAALEYRDEAAIRNATIEARKPIAQKMADADSINTKLRAKKRRLEILAEVTGYQQKSDALTARLAAIAAEKDEALAKTTFPYPGLTFSEDGILLNNRPFTEEQCSQAQICKAAVAIGFAFKPRIRVVLIKDAAILSQASLQAIAEMAEANEGQVWQEVITSDDPTALEIVDGAIKE